MLLLLFKLAASLSVLGLYFFFNEHMIVSTAVSRNYLGASAEKMGGEYFCTCALLHLLFVLFVKNCFSVIASFWVRKPHYHYSAGRQIMVIALLHCVVKLCFSSW